MPSELGTTTRLFDLVASGISDRGGEGAASMRKSVYC